MILVSGLSRPKEKLKSNMNVSKLSSKKKSSGSSSQNASKKSQLVQKSISSMFNKKSTTTDQDSKKKSELDENKDPNTLDQFMEISQTQVKY